MSDYDVEAVDRLPFTTPAKSARYRTEDYRGATSGSATRDVAMH